ncbi:hypothetical protein P691DRAFT_640574, partial [Macrolepiota fuliginosa MF-IS2]
LCRAGGLLRKTIHSTPTFHRQEWQDTVFVELDGNIPGMKGLLVARVLLFFSFHYHNQDLSCALINWFVHDSDDP